MEDDQYQWRDPLLLTDVSWQESGSSHNTPILSSPPNPSRDHSIRFHSEDASDSSPSFQVPAMADPVLLHHNVIEEVSSTGDFSDPIEDGVVDGRSILGFSLSPDLVVSAASPDVPGDTNDFLKSAYLKNMENSVELSFEEGISGSEMKASYEASAEKLQAADERAFLEASFELLPPREIEEKSENDLPIISINVGCTERGVASKGTNFLQDNFFTGGDTIMTDAMFGDEECLPLYQTARFGNFSYHFSSLDPGNYLIDLHLAEIVFTNGPTGMRVFDVYIQEKKAVCSIDIYARVGANSPLLISGLEAFVNADGGLCIKFEGVTRTPIVCGISIRKGSCASFRKGDLIEFRAVSQTPECESPNDNSDNEVRGETQKLQREYEFQKRKLTETKQALIELKRDNELKSKECKEAQKSLRDLQNELMRKSMHVGSLAFAIEGQVKEKSKWFSSLRDLERKLKILKMEQISLLEEALAYKSMQAEMKLMSSTIHSKMKQHADQDEALKLKFMNGAKERKDLYNKVLELKGNIRVFCRCRPLSAEEINAGASMAVDFESARDGELTVKSNGTNRKSFKFDAVFNPQADQVNVFEDTAPFATSVLDGYNVCIFAYGQTGTGKTFTMEGTDEARGVNFRTLAELFRIIKEREKLFRYDISVSVMEVYNEQIRDLLISGFQPGGAAKRLEIRQVGEGNHHVPGLVEAHVDNMSEVWEVLKSGSNARAVGSTNVNEHSSRSHCIHCVMVKGENLLNGECTRSKLWLVDLAGSERIAKTEVQGERLKETQNINRSLSALGDVISALATKCPHIPFRNSKLTHLLQDSLGGDSKTLMFVQISPNENDLSETLCSLNFASRVRGIELGPAKKQVDSAELLKYKQLFEKSKQDIKSKDLHIKKMEETIHCVDVKMKEKDLKNKSLQEKVKELEAQLLAEKNMARQQVDTKFIEQEEQNATLRPPLANRPLGSYKNVPEPVNGAITTEDAISARTLTEYNRSFKPLLPLPPVDGFVKYSYPTEKENNREMGEHPPLPKRAGRASICPVARRTPAAPIPRRNSLNPLPNALSSVQLTPPTLPLIPMQVNEEKENADGETTCLPEKTLTYSPKGLKGSGKKLSNMLRRSLHRKIHSNMPQQPHFRKVGVNVGMEKVRVSIGSKAHRVLLGNGRRVGGREVQQKQGHKEKERGWNIGTAGKNVI